MISYGAAERDGEALKVLGARVNRVRGWVAALCVSVGLAAGIGGYVVLRQLQLELIGVHVPYLTGAVTLGLALGATGIATKLISRFLIRRRSGAWIEEIGARYEVAAEPLRQFLDIWR